jgi:copper resistance protein B
MAPAPAAAPPAEAMSGPAHAADKVFGAEVMENAREELRETHGAIRVFRAGVDQLEVYFQQGRDGFSWADLHFWYGGDINRLWIKSEGEGDFGEGVERAEVQALWSHGIAPFFDLQGGVRYDLGPDPDSGYLVLGVQGVTPYWFEIDAALFLSHRGDITARFEGEYDQRITQRLILQPRMELELALQDVPELGTGSGLSSAEAGLRLRYEFMPEFAPYVGIQDERAFGDTARFSRAAGEDVGGWSFIMGVRAWF